MKDNWTDFEKYVFDKLEKIDRRLTVIEVKAALWGSIAGLVTAAFLKAFWS